MRLRVVIACMVFAAGLGAGSSVWAWSKRGHATIAMTALSKMPESVPAFFRDAVKELHDLASEPDNWKAVRGSALQRTESPEHFIDLEYLGDHPIPKNRQDATKLYYSLNAEPDNPDFRPENIGYLPYALIEGRQKLALAFADHRRDPQSASARMKCIVYAGLLCHYSGDAAMPLHTSKFHDGLAAPAKGAPKPFQGIHRKIDSFPGDQGFGLKEMGAGVEPREIKDVWEYVVTFLKASHAEVGRCYDMEKEGKFDKPDEATREFIKTRTRAATQFTADLWYSAWLESEKLAAKPRPFEQ